MTVTNEKLQQSVRAEQIGAAIAEYLLAADSGKPLASNVWLDQYPDLHSELSAFLQADSNWESLLATPASKRGTGSTWRQVNSSSGDFDELEIDGYEILEPLGRGGMGSVYRARHVSLDRLVALKIPHGVDLSLEDQRRFEREAEAVATLDHSHIVPIYDVGKSLKRPFLTMKLYNGGSLKLLGKVEPRRAAILMVAIAEAVDHAHQRGILHRDLKPSNVLLDDQGQPVVTDFGLAKQIDRDAAAGDETTIGAMLGTPAYMAPEQITGEATTLSDVYSLGAILYSLLTGGPPFTGNSPIDVLSKVRHSDPIALRKLCSSIPCDLETICLKCLNKEPRKRYESAKELGRDLNAWLNHQPIHARPVTQLDRLQLWIRRNPSLALSVGVTAVALLTAIAAMGWMLVRAERDNRLLQAERSVAVENLQLAEQAIDSLLSEVQDELVHFPAIDKVRTRMLTNALDLQQTIMLRNGAQLVSRVEDPTARIRMAELYWELGQVTEASHELEKVRESLQRLDAADQNGGNTGFSLKMRCRTNQLISEIHQHFHRFQEAEDALTDLIEMRENEKEQLWPLGEEFAYLTARRQRAILIAKHSQDTSFVEFARVLRETESIQARAKSGTVAEQRRALELLANASNSYGIALRVDGQADAAIEYYRKTVDAYKQLSNSDPLNHLQKSGLAATLLNLGNIFIQRREYQDAAQSYLDSMNLYKELVIENPSRTSNKEKVIGTLVGLGIASSRANRVEQAIELYAEAQELLERYDREHPELTETWNRQLSNVLTNLVNSYIETEQLDEAHRVADRAIAIRRVGNAADPDGGNGASGLAGALGNKAAIFESEDRQSEALELLEEAIEFHAVALTFAPRSTEFLRRYEFDVRRQLRIYLRDANFEAMQQSLEQVRRLTESDPKMFSEMLMFVKGLPEAASRDAQAVLDSFQ